MAVAKKCDLCGKLYESYNDDLNSEKPNGFILISIDTKSKYYGYGSTDCCPDCMETLLQCIKRLGGNKNE